MAEIDDEQEEETSDYEDEIYEEETVFIMRGWTPKLINTYYCKRCKDAGIEHKVIDIPGPITDDECDFGPGLPTTMRHCTGCSAEDGPWVSAELVGCWD